MTHGETSAGRPGQARADIVLIGDHGDEDISATYVTSGPDHAA
jgi:hypothetical protein